MMNGRKNEARSGRFNESAFVGAMWNLSGGDCSLFGNDPFCVNVPILLLLSAFFFLVEMKLVACGMKTYSTNYHKYVTALADHTYCLQEYISSHVGSLRS